MQSVAEMCMDIDDGKFGPAEPMLVDLKFRFRAKQPERQLSPRGSIQRRILGGGIFGSISGCVGWRSLSIGKVRFRPQE